MCVCVERINSQKVLTLRRGVFAPFDTSNEIVPQHTLNDPSHIMLANLTSSKHTFISSHLFTHLPLRRFPLRSHLTRQSGRHVQPSPQIMKRCWSLPINQATCWSFSIDHQLLPWSSLNQGHFLWIACGRPLQLYLKHLLSNNLSCGA